MVLPPGFQITDQVLLAGMAWFALADLLCVPLLARFTRPDRFSHLKWPLILSSAAVWFTIWAWVLSWGWEIVYAYVFPAWSRGVLPVFMALFYAAVAWLLWRLALPHARPAAWFCLLGGLVGILTHIYAVLRGITTGPPILQAASPAVAVLFAAFEFILYWCAILALALLLDRLFTRGVPSPSATPGIGAPGG